MEKKLISVHAVTIHIYTIAIALLVLLLLVLGIKYWHLKLSVQGYTRSTVWMNEQEKPTGFISDYGVIIAQSVQSIPASSLQNYVAAISKDLNRDIVVVDGSKKILADTLSSNSGKTYKYDLGSEVQLTISDGKLRSFEEKSSDYPNGITEIVVPMKNAKGDIVGAVLISDSELLR